MCVSVSKVCSLEWQEVSLADFEAPSFFSLCTKCTLLQLNRLDNTEVWVLSQTLLDIELNKTDYIL